jgi:hypothetical protein
MNWELKQIKSWTFLLVLLVIAQIGVSQVAPEKYWIQFTDKNNSPFSVNTPLAYLSQRAIDRRLAQNIAITSQDFPVNPTYVTGVKQVANVNVLISSRWLNGIVIQTTDTAGLDLIMNLPFVDSVNSESVEALELPGKVSTKMKINGVVTANETDNSIVSEGINYGLADHQNKMLGIDFVHDLGFTGNGMVIAVLDAGFKGADTTEVLTPTFNNGQILGTWDFVLGQPVNYSSHSTHGKWVLNCMGANLPGRYVGSAPDASYWLLRTEDAPTENIIEEYNWVAGAEFADSVGADVFNTSLGYTTFDDSTKSHTYADLDGNTTIITRGADIAASKGIIVVNSAGNSGAGPWYYIGAPADGDSVLAIGAVEASGVVTGFSSRGPSSDLRTKPNVMALGGSVPMPLGLDSTIYINGTSFSGPILAGAAACLWQSRITYESMEVFHAIEESANKFSNPNDDYGYGIPNFGMAYFFITGVDEMNNDALSIQAYPNPTNGFVYLPVLDVNNVTLTVLDIVGHKVNNFKPTVLDGSLLIDLSDYPNGVYLIHVATETENQIVRVIKE